MRKNEYGPKKDSRKQNSNKGRKDWGGSRTGKTRSEFEGNRTGAGRGRSEFEGNRTGAGRGRSEFEGNRTGAGRGRSEFEGNRAGAGRGRSGYDDRGERPRISQDSAPGAKRGAGERNKGYTRREESFENRKHRKDEGYNRPKRSSYRNEEAYKGKRKGTRTDQRFDNQYTREPVATPKSTNYLPVELAESNLDREDRIEGRNSVFETIRSGRPLNKLFVLKDNTDVMISRIVAMAREKDIPIQYLERNRLDTISQTRTHQGVILEVAAKEYVEVDDIIKIAEEKGEQPFIVVLDGITDTNNLGSIIRSAECAGVHGIILPKRRSATLNATVAKVAAGALEYVPVARVSNLVQVLRGLKKQGLWIVGADMDGDSNYHNTDLTGPTAIVIGSEGEGLARLVKGECDLMVKIPMNGKISSLNAGVAAALIMFEVLRQRG